MVRRGRPFTVPEDVPGYDTAGGWALVLIASLGAGFAIVAGLLGGRRLWLGEVALALAGLGAVIAEGAFHEPGGDRTEWNPTNWYWAAIVVAGAWLVVAAIAGVLIPREPVGWLRRDLNPPSTRVTLAFTAASASAVALVVGAVGPWQTVALASRSGLEGTAEATPALIPALLAVLGLLSYWRLGNRRALFAVPWFAIAAGAWSIYYQVDIYRDDDLNAGWGLNLAAGASVALALSSAIILFHRGRSLLAPVAEPGLDAQPLVDSSLAEPIPSPAVPGDNPQAESPGATREDSA